MDERVNGEHMIAHPGGDVKDAFESVPRGAPSVEETTRGAKGRGSESGSGGGETR